MTALNPFTTAPAPESRIVSAAARAAGQTVAQAEISDRPNYVAIYASTIFAMIMLFLLGVAIPASMVYGNAVGWALGGFCAFWGGPSFGVMAASARVSSWYEKHDEHL